MCPVHKIARLIESNHNAAPGNPVGRNGIGNMYRIFYYQAGSAINAAEVVEIECADGLAWWSLRIIEIVKPYQQAIVFPVKRFCGNINKKRKIASIMGHQILAIEPDFGHLHGSPNFDGNMLSATAFGYLEEFAVKCTSLPMVFADYKWFNMGGVWQTYVFPDKVSGRFFLKKLRHI